MAADDARGADEGQRAARDARVGDGETVCQRGGVPHLRGGGADSWRIWVHQGLPGGEVLSRCEAVHHRRGDERGSARREFRGGRGERGPAGAKGKPWNDGPRSKQATQNTVGLSTTRGGR